MTDKKQSDLRLDRQVCFSLYSASNAVVRAYRPLLKRLELTYLQYIVMMVLWEKDNIGVTELGERVHLDSGTLTPLLKRLESKGLLSRLVSQKDERARCIKLTAAGRSLEEEAAKVPEQIMCRLSLPLDQLISLKRQCDDLLLMLAESQAE